MFTLLKRKAQNSDAIMGKRTPQSGLSDWDEVQNLEAVVVDPRSLKRAGRAKGRRRNRGYENRLLRTTLDSIDLEATADWDDEALNDRGAQWELRKPGPGAG